jgi:predicted lipid-binding transport protein (Tim44 family)
MKHLLRSTLLVLAVTTAFAPTLSEAKRLGGGGSAGLQRSLPSRSTPPAQTPPTPAQPGAAPQAPAQQAAPMAGAAAQTAQAARKRSWLGPLAGLAAGLGLAALMSHLGLGEAFGEFLMVALLLMALAFVVTWFLKRRGTPAAAGAGNPAWAGASAGAPLQRQADPEPARVGWPPASTSTGGGLPGSAAASFAPGAATTASALPADFDRAGFERTARMIFIRMQAANDRADLNDLRQFTTPELFAAIRVDLQDRGSRPQETDVVEVRAEVIDFVREPGRDIVSVRYSGLIREEAGQDAAPFAEAWHLVQERGESAWRIAGIQPLAD